MKRTANALRRVGAVLASTLNIGLFDVTEYGEFCEKCCEKEKERRVRDCWNNRGRVMMEVIREKGWEMEWVDIKERVGGVWLLMVYHQNNGDRLIDSHPSVHPSTWR